MCSECSPGLTERDRSGEHPLLVHGAEIRLMFYHLHSENMPIQIPWKIQIETE